MVSTKAVPGEGRITLHALRVGTGAYQVRVEQANIDGGWPSVFVLLVHALGIVANQMFPGRAIGQSPLFVAICSVMQAFMHSVLQAEPRARVEVVSPGVLNNLEQKG